MSPGTDVIGIAILLLDWFGTCTPKKGDKTKAIYKFDDIHNLNIDYLDEGNHHQFHKKDPPRLGQVSNSPDLRLNQNYLAAGAAASAAGAAAASAGLAASFFLDLEEIEKMTVRGPEASVTFSGSLKSLA